MTGAPPWQIKVVETISLVGPEARRRALEQAGANTFLRRSARARPGRNRATASSVSG